MGAPAAQSGSGPRSTGTAPALACGAAGPPSGATTSPASAPGTGGGRAGQTILSRLRHQRDARETVLPELRHEPVDSAAWYAAGAAASNKGRATAPVSRSRA